VVVEGEHHPEPLAAAVDQRVERVRLDDPVQRGSSAGSSSRALATASTTVGTNDSSLPGSWVARARTSGRFGPSYPVITRYHLG
jgi:hypothetical protein